MLRVWLLLIGIGLHTAGCDAEIPVCSFGTHDIPERWIAEEICPDGRSGCTICVGQATCDGRPIDWSEYEEECRCPEPRTRGCTDAGP